MKRKRLYISITAIFILLVLVFSGYICKPRNSESHIEQNKGSANDIIYNDVDIQKDEDNKIDNNTIDKVTLKNADIHNIAVFGIDSENGDKGRSDAAMIVSIDNEHNKIKITSIARDSLVYIPEKETKEKLTHAYAYGGASLAVATINKNFNTNIKDYISVNFSGMEKIVDLVGGVEVNLSKKEVQYLNDYSLKAGKNVNLNGEQAVKYSRIRYIDSDIVRGNRQREILISLFHKIKGMKKTSYLKLARECMKICTTSIKQKDIISMVPTLLKSDISIEQFSCPAELSETVWGGIMDSGAWCWVYNTKGASKAILNFIYEDIYDNSDIKLPKATVTTDILTASEWKRNVA